MKHYKLAAWPDLPSAFNRTGYQRMLHQMSQRHVSVQQLMHESGFARGAVMQFLDSLSDRQLLLESEPTGSLGSSGPTRAVAWLRRTFMAEGHA